MHFKAETQSINFKIQGLAKEGLTEVCIDLSIEDSYREVLKKLQFNLTQSIFEDDFRIMLRIENTNITLDTADLETEEIKSSRYIVV